MKKEIRRQLKCDYEKLEIQPSEDLWDRMEFEKKKTQALFFQWWKYAAVVLFLISLCSVFYFNSGQAGENNDIAKNRNSINSVHQKSNVEIITSNINHNENNIAMTSDENQINETAQKEKVINNTQKPLPLNNPVSAVEEKIIINDFNENPIPENKITSSFGEKPLVAERKKGNYIKADELLLAIELDKTRKESHDHRKTFGVLDMGKIKIKSPASFKILGMTVFSDSLETQ